MNSETNDVEGIWKDDLLGRKDEALLLIAFIERIASARRDQGIAKSYNLAVDAGYGAGKTFFLRRLAQHLKIDHHVAFIDAWSDDLQDDPLTALTATLHTAFSDLIPNDEHTRNSWNQVLVTSGRIANIVGRGLLRRGVGFLITQSATEAAEAVLQSANIEIGELQGALTDDAKGAVPDSLEDSQKSSERMKLRINEFREAKNAVSDLKHALSSLVAQVHQNGKELPVVIIIDEIDRCRPTYAIKLFEEIKHLFDVEGIVFVLGMHRAELAHSVAGAYGPGFDGWNYLRRFINKTYHLKTPSLAPLVESLLNEMVVDVSRLRYPQTVSDDQNMTNMPIPVVIAAYMGSYELKARDAAAVVEAIQTCLFLSGDKYLLLGYLLPLTLSSMRKDYDGTVVQPKAWTVPWSLFLGGNDKISVEEYARKVRMFAGSPEDGLFRRGNSQPLDPVAQEVFRLVMNDAFSSDPLGHPNKYAEVLETVARFD